jgi:hypothetical protein
MPQTTSSPRKEVLKAILSDLGVAINLRAVIVTTFQYLPLYKKKLSKNKLDAILKMSSDFF